MQRHEAAGHRSTGRRGARPRRLNAHIGEGGSCQQHLQREQALHRERDARRSAEQDSPLAALIDPGRLDRDFIVEDGGESDGLQWLVLKPKQGADDAAFQSARLGLGQDGLARMEIIDALGQRTRIAFSGWKRNPAFPADTFTYTPPAGVDVVGEG